MKHTQKSKTYVAVWDDGHDTRTFEFESEYRKGSKQNLQDAIDTYNHRWGGYGFYGKRTAGVNIKVVVEYKLD